MTKAEAIHLRGSVRTAELGQTSQAQYLLMQQWTVPLSLQEQEMLIRCFPPSTFLASRDFCFRHFLHSWDFCLLSNVQWICLPSTCPVCPQMVSISSLSLLCPEAVQLLPQCRKHHPLQPAVSFMDFFSVAPLAPCLSS